MNKIIFILAVYDTLTKWASIQTYNNLRYKTVVFRAQNSYTLLDAWLGTNLHLTFALLFLYLTLDFQANIGIVGIYTKQK